ncbi:MAG: LD-carboxypeptidase [Roseiflexaceae bacterium]
MAVRLYITCPSYAFRSPAERSKIIWRAQTWADQLSWDVTISPLLSRYYPAGAWLPTEQRAEDLQRALEYDIVWAARGGYAAVHLVPALLQADPPRTPLLIGYSDPTVLHACWHVRGWAPRLYGTLGDQVNESRQGESLLQIFKGQPLQINSDSEPAVLVLRPGQAQGHVFAGCLVVLASLCGTPACPDLRGHILMIEDVNERPYAIDFALNQLYLSGALDGVVALVGGSFSSEGDAEYGGPSSEAILAEWGARLGIPTIARVPFGHVEDHLVVPCGVTATFNANANGSWSLAWPELGAFKLD